MQSNRQAILNDIKSTVHRLDPSAEVILYGSQARGDYHEESDWDVLVLIDEVNDTPKFKGTLTDALYDVELKHSAIITAIIRNRAWWSEMGLTPFYKEVSKDGIVL